MTGEIASGERLAEDALVAVCRMWQRPIVHRDPLLAARRALAAATRRRSRFRPPRLRGALELQDFRPTTTEEAEGAGGAVDVELLWLSLDHLSPSERLTVALCYASGLTIEEASRVLRRPAATVRRLYWRALTELRKGADLPDETVPDPDTPADRGFEDLVTRAVRSHVDVPLDVEPLLRRVAEHTAHGGQRPRWDRVLAGTTGVAVVGAVCALLWSLLGGDAPHRRDALPRPPLPPGTQLVGYRSLVAVVPSDWTLAELPCGRIVAAGTTYRDWTRTGQCTAAGGVPSVTFTDAPLNFAPMSAPPQRTGRVAGYVSMRTLLTRVDGVYQQTVFVFGARFMMTVRSPDPAVLATIISSVRAVPDGYAIVPACERLPVREAVASLSDAGLTPKIAFTSSLSVRYGAPPVTFQNRPSGSVVRAGTPVALTIPSF